MSVGKYAVGKAPVGAELPTLSPPVANFVGVPTSGAAPLSVIFIDISTHVPTSWHWQKNSGLAWVDFAGTPTVQDPTESFAAGTWSVRLTAANVGGSDTKTRTDYIASGVPPVPPVPPAAPSGRGGSTAPLVDPPGARVPVPSDAGAGKPELWKNLGRG